MLMLRSIVGHTWQRSFGKSLMSTDTAAFPVSASIKSKLEAALAPIEHLEIINESSKHNVPVNSETHFKVIIVASVFENCKTLIQRHRLVNHVLRDEIATDGPVHALSIIAKSPKQWKAMMSEGKMVPPSPSCRGGDGTLPSQNSTTEK